MRDWLKATQSFGSEDPVIIRPNSDTKHERIIDVPAHKLPPALRMPNSHFVAVFGGPDIIRVETAGPAWLEIQNQIRTVLNRDWDPIRVAGVVEDEYDIYIEEI